MPLFLAAGRTVLSLAEAQSTMPVSHFSKGRFEIGKGERRRVSGPFCPREGLVLPGNKQKGMLR